MKKILAILLLGFAVTAAYGVVNVDWQATAGFYFSADPNTGILGPAGSGKSTIAQLMYSPDAVKDDITTNRIGTSNDVIFGTVTITETGNLTEYAAFGPENFTQTFTNGYVYALIFQKDNVESGDWYYSTPLMTLTNVTPSTPQTLEMNSDIIFGDAIDGLFGAQVTGGRKLTIINGNGTTASSYTNGAIVAIAADAVIGQAFVQWTGATQYVASVTSANTTLTMPSSNITLTATYSNLNYSLTVNGGTGSGTNYIYTQTVPISASNAAIGKAFSQWIGATQYVASVTSANTSVTMPASDISVTATYSNLNYTLTVAGGTGGGTMYTNTQVVPISATNVPAQAFFSHWTGATQYVASVTSANTTVTMPASNIAVTSTYANISFLAPVISEVSGGIIPGKYEPGETIKITVNSTNGGMADVSNITNTLSAPAYFSITPPSATYSLAARQTNATVYTVVISNTTPAGNYTFNVENQSGGMIWTNSFTLPVFIGGNPSVTNALTINVVNGGTNTGTVALTNAGNGGISYTVTDDGRLPTGNYIVTTQGEDRVSFIPAQFSPDTVSTNWSGRTSIGFNMPVFGINYNTFTVNSNGTLTLSTNAAGASPVTLQVFQSATGVNTNSFQFLKSTNRLVVAWNNGTGREFQAWLNSDGTIQYLYEYGIGSGGTIGISTQAITYAAGLTGRDGLLLTPSHWVTYTPTDGSVGAGSSQLLTFTANAAGRANGTYQFNSLVNWQNGSNSVIQVSVVVSTATQTLQVVSSVPFSFQGPAGFITSTNMVVSNNGNAALSYTITDTGMKTAKYTTNNVPYLWQEIPKAADYILSPSQLDRALLDIGFPFIYFGNIYTTLTVSVNGTITLGGTNGTQIISVFGASLMLDDNASVRIFPDSGFNRFTVTWDSMFHNGGGIDQSFQAILSRDGSILCNYHQLGKGWSNGIIRLSDSSGTVTGTLSKEMTKITVTNTTPVYSSSVITIGNVTFTNQVQTGVTTNIVTTLTDTTGDQAIKFIPGQKQIISASPTSGTIPANTATNILITGDARSLAANGPNNVSNSTVLTFNYSSPTKTTNVTVNFTATNSANTAYDTLAAEVVEAMWGADAVVNVQADAGGVRTINWPAPNDGIPRIYKVWYTLDLMQGFQLLATVENGTSYVDRDHPNAQAIYYKVTVE